MRDHSEVPTTRQHVDDLGVAATLSAWSTQVQLAAFRPRFPVDSALAGCEVCLAEDGSWRSRAPDWDAGVSAQSLIQGSNIDLSTPAGTLTIRSAHRVTVDMDLRLAGESLAVGFEAHKPAGGSRILRAYLHVDGASTFEFPRNLKAPDGAVQDVGAFSLDLDGIELSVLHFRAQTMWALECRTGALEEEQFHDIVRDFAILFSYLTGEWIRGKVCIACFQPDGALSSALWHQGQPVQQIGYRPIPTSFRDISLARQSLAAAFRPPLAEANLSKVFGAFRHDRRLATPVEYLTRWPALPLEMRGVALSIALESLTKLLSQDADAAPSGILKKAVWKPVLVSLLAALNAHTEVDTASLETLRKKLTSLNYLSNAAKLSAPFGALGVELRDCETEAIGRRNNLLHEGRVIDPNANSDSAANRKLAYCTEMAIYTAVNRLLLKHLGYEGPAIDWCHEGTRNGNLEFVVG